MLVRVGTCQYVLVCFGKFWYVLVRFGTFCYVLVHFVMFCYMLVHVVTFWYLLVHDVTYWYMFGTCFVHAIFLVYCPRGLRLNYIPVLLIRNRNQTFGHALFLRKLSISLCVRICVRVTRSKKRIYALKKSPLVIMLRPGYDFGQRRSYPQFVRFWGSRNKQCSRFMA